MYKIKITSNYYTNLFIIIIIIIIIMEPVGEVSLVGLVESEFKFELSRYDNPNVRLRQTDRQTDNVIVRTEAAMSK